MSLIDKPGLYDMPADAYHADPCVEPSLSSGIAKLLLDRTPRHAWTAHPRLNPKFERKNEAKFDLGQAAHAMMLRDERAFCIVDADDWRTKAAKEAREQAYAEGRIPLLAEQWERVREMTNAAHAQLEHHDECHDALLKGSPEQTLIWREGLSWCRCRLDWLPDNRSGRTLVLYDYKSTGVSANPDVWARVMFSTGCDVQAAFYERGVRAALDYGGEIVFRFIVQEDEPPYALSVVQLSPGALAMAERKVQRALDLWAWCRAEGRWPGYPAMVAHVDPPVWAERSWTDSEDREDALRAGGQDLKKLMLDWQAPLERSA